MDSFMNEFEEFACNRMAVAIQGLMQNPEYVKRNEEKRKLNKEVRATMGDSLFSKVDVAHGRICEFEEIAYYKQGFKDGMALVREFGGVR